jgi:hypothetical protein
MDKHLLIFFIVDIIITILQLIICVKISKKHEIMK